MSTEVLNTKCWHEIGLHVTQISISCSMIHYRSIIIMLLWNKGTYSCYYERKTFYTVLNLKFICVLNCSQVIVIYKASLWSPNWDYMHMAAVTKNAWRHLLRACPHLAFNTSLSAVSVRSENFGHEWFLWLYEDPFFRHCSFVFQICSISWSCHSCANKLISKF